MHRKKGTTKPYDDFEAIVGRMKESIWHRLSSEVDSQKKGFFGLISNAATRREEKARSVKLANLQARHPPPPWGGHLPQQHQSERTYSNGNHTSNNSNNGFTLKRQFTSVAESKQRNSLQANSSNVLGNSGNPINGKSILNASGSSNGFATSKRPRLNGTEEASPPPLDDTLNGNTSRRISARRPAPKHNPDYESDNSDSQDHPPAPLEGDSGGVGVGDSNGNALLFGCLYNPAECHFTADRQTSVFQHVRRVHFGLPASIKEMKRMGIVDYRDAKRYIRYPAGQQPPPGTFSVAYEEVEGTEPSDYASEYAEAEYREEASEELQQQQHHQAEPEYVEYETDAPEYEYDPDGVQVEEVEPNYAQEEYQGNADDKEDDDSEVELLFDSGPKVSYGQPIISEVSPPPVTVAEADPETEIRKASPKPKTVTSDPSPSAAPSPSSSTTSKSIYLPRTYRYYKERSVHCYIPGCTTELSTIIELQVHLHSQHQVRAFRCLMVNCSRSFDDGRQLSDHLNQVHRRYNESLSCAVCGLQQANYTALQKHNHLFHMPGWYQCIVGDCGYVSEVRHDVITHHHRCHGCGDCKEILPDRKARLEHRRTVHGGGNTASNTRNSNGTDKVHVITI